VEGSFITGGPVRKNGQTFFRHPQKKIQTVGERHPHPKKEASRFGGRPGNEEN